MCTAPREMNKGSIMWMMTFAVDWIITDNVISWFLFFSLSLSSLPPPHLAAQFFHRREKIKFFHGRLPRGLVKEICPEWIKPWRVFKTLLKNARADMSGLNRKGKRVTESTARSVLGAWAHFKWIPSRLMMTLSKKVSCYFPRRTKRKNIINLFGGERKIPSWVSERACLETADVISMTCLHAAIARRYPPLVQPVHKSATTGLSVDKKGEAKKKETDKLKWIIGWTKKKKLWRVNSLLRGQNGKNPGSRASVYTSKRKSSI